MAAGDADGDAAGEDARTLDLAVRDGISQRHVGVTGRAGHAHGGQVQCFGRGLYAPGQGFFPRLTDGFYYDNRLLVSRGATNSASAPRLFNPCEIIMLKIEKV